MKHKIILFYKFIELDDPATFRNEQKELVDTLGIKGRLLVGKEGINGTFEGTPEAIEQYMQTVHDDPRFADMPFKESEGTDDGTAFTKAKIKVRDEIVVLGTGPLDQSKTAPTVTADELHQMYEDDEDFVVLDLRNDYEIKAGAFDRTVDPGLTNFRDLPNKMDELEELKRQKKIVTVCTGGIRCEKATCLMDEYGFDNLYQLEDGIHTYMQKYPGQYFKGTLFVFDNRMVTDVVDTPDKEVIGMCEYCENKTERFYSDDSTRPTRKVLVCDDCYMIRKNELRDPVEFKKTI